MLATIAGAAVGANGYLVFGTFFGWQAQIALATFGVLSVFCFRLALDSKDPARGASSHRPSVAAGLATHRLAVRDLRRPVARHAVRLSGQPWVGRVASRSVRDRLVRHYGRTDRRTTAARASPRIRELSAEWTDELSRTWSRYDQRYPPTRSDSFPERKHSCRHGPIWDWQRSPVIILFAIVAFAVGLTRGAGLSQRSPASFWEQGLFSPPRSPASESAMCCRPNGP